MIIDSHQHLWTLSRGDYPWPNESVAPIFKDFKPADLEPHLKRNGVNKTVIVQATDTVAETEFLLSLEESTDFIAGVVGWVDLSADDAIETIDRLSANKALKSLRPMLQNIDNSDWILQTNVLKALSHMSDIGLRFDALIQPRHLAPILQLAKELPQLPIVIDHIAKPKMGDMQQPDALWLDGMAALGQQSNVDCKLSGMMTEAGKGCTQEDLAPFAAHVLQAFGADKVMWGSDWPVLELAGTYDLWMEMATKLTAHLNPHEKSAVFGDNAAKFYDL